jgi:hypothetical protein
MDRDRDFDSRTPTYWNRHDGPIWINECFELAWALWEATGDGTESGSLPVGDRELRFDVEENRLSVAGIFMPDHPALLQGFIRVVAAWPAYAATADAEGKQGPVTFEWEAWSRQTDDGKFEPLQWGKISAVMGKGKDVFDHEGMKVARALLEATHGMAEDGAIEWEIDGVKLLFGWYAYFRWDHAGEAVALSIGEMYTVKDDREEPGWRCTRPRSIHKSIAGYAAVILRREASRVERERTREEDREQLKRWASGEEDPFKEDDEP